MLAGKTITGIRGGIISGKRKSPQKDPHPRRSLHKKKEPRKGNPTGKWRSPYSLTHPLPPLLFGFELWSAGRFTPCSTPTRVCVTWSVAQIGGQDGRGCLQGAQIIINRRPPKKRNLVCLLSCRLHRLRQLIPKLRIDLLGAVAQHR